MSADGNDYYTRVFQVATIHRLILHLKTEEFFKEGLGGKAFEERLSQIDIRID